MRLEMTMEDAVLLGEAVAAYQHRVLESLTDTQDQDFRESLKLRFERLDRLKNALDLGWISGVATKIEPLSPVADLSVRAM